MRILVTGGAGFIGSHIVDALVTRGDQVTVVDAECADNDIFFKNPGARYLKQSVLDQSALGAAMAGVDQVFHLAAESRIGPAVENPVYATEVNVVGTCKVLQAARDAGVKAFVYSSTSACYGLKNSPPLHEEMPLDNLNPYSTSKLAGEDLCKMYASLYGLPTVSLRYFNVFGERMPSRGQYAPVLGIFLRQYKAGEPLTVVGDGAQRRDFVHVSDIVQANLLAAQHAAKNAGAVFNVGSGSNISVLEIAQLFAAPIQYLPPRAGESRNTLACLKRIKAHLGFQPRVSVGEWIATQLG